LAYDGYDPARTSFSPSSAPDTNETAWVSDLPGGTVWAYPIVAEGKLFIGAGGFLNAFDENNGSLLWSFSTPGQPGYPVVAAVTNGRGFFGTAEPGPGGAIYALNTTTSEQIWNFTTEGYSRPLIVLEDRLYFGVDLASTGKLYCINATDGAHIWNYTTQDKGITVAAAYGKVYVGCGHWITSSTAAFYCLDMYDGSFVWSFETGRDLGDLGSVDNGKVYCAASYEGWDHIIYALNATNGGVVWSTDRYSNGEGGKFAVAYGKVFFGTVRGARGVYALNETNGDEIWAFPLAGGGAAGGPVVADGKVFFADGNPSHMVYAVDEATGGVVWSYKIGGSVHSLSSAIANGRVFVADHYDSKLYAFGEPPSPPPPPLSVLINPLSASINTGDTLTFTSIVTGGTPSYSYQWYLDGSPVSSATSSSWAFTPPTSGIYYVHLEVTDADDNTIQSENARIIVIGIMPVGGYSLSIKDYTAETPLRLYLALVAILTVSFTMIKRKTYKRTKRL